jgi:hypothetical protein
MGVKVYGKGFVLTPDQCSELIAKDPRNAERIYPYLGGDEINWSPTQDFARFVIDFSELSLSEAEAWPDLLEIVRRNVKPERDKLRADPKTYALARCKAMSPLARWQRAR